ncbi:MFS transporter [Streptomyces sp. B1I3]|uniref:MFS transporter n=1 Tax=Streptomyces sp. B1I3 TaxID=3042264 RepID=UPI00277F2736|nr:MFS transporter [Streptomyces sp. B1I3]MDQ0791546.1 MFS family permease [Streptomyces sp. B1I3]
MTTHVDTKPTYLAVLAVREARMPLLGSCLARMSFAVLPLSLLLSVRNATGSFAVAGLASGALSATLTLFAPARARLIDRKGSRTGLIRLTVPYLLGLAALITLAETGAPTAALLGAAAVAGMFAPPLGPTMRVLWAKILHGRQPLLPTAYALDSVTEEVVFTMGPLLAGGLIAVAAPLASMITVMALITSGTACFVLSAATAAAPASDAPDAGRPHGRPMALPGMRTIVLSFGGVGLVIGVLQVALPFIATHAGSPSAGGVLLALLSVGSAVGGLTYGRISWRATPVQRFAVLVTGFTLTVLPLCLTESPVLVGAFAFLVGLCLAPLFITAYLLVNDLVTASRTAPTEANTWVSTANNGGFAAGSAAAGVLLEFQGPTLTVTAAFAVAAAIAVTTILRRRTLVPDAANVEPSAAKTIEAER